MKKFFVCALLFLLTTSLTACGSKKEQAPVSSSGPTLQVESSEQSDGVLDESSESNAQKQSYAVGDIILGDGSIFQPENLAIDRDDLPVAVIVCTNENGTALGLGVHHSGEPLPWTEVEHPDDSPAFRFADEYGAAFGLPDDYTDGWRMPDIDELRAIYQERETLNHALQTIYGLDDTAAIDGLGTNWYWSSTPSDENEGYAWFVHFVNGYAADCPQDFTNLHVLVVREFD